MPITSRAGLLGFLLALSAISLPAAPSRAAGSASAPQDQGPPAADSASEATLPLSIDDRLHRLAAAIRERERGIDPSLRPQRDQQLAYGFVNGGRGGWGNTAYRGGFVNGHPYYGRPGFVNGGGGFVNGRYGGGGFLNGPNRGGVFRNW